MTHAPSSAGRHHRALVVTLVLTAGYLVAEIMGAMLTGSLALLADAGHMFTDVGGLALALFAIWFAQRPATPARTYGYYRAEILAALANGVVLIGVSLYILAEAYKRFWNPPPVASGWMLIIAAIGLAVNLVGMWVLQAGSAESLNLKGAYFEVLSDMVSSLGVILAALIMWGNGVALCGSTGIRWHRAVYPTPHLETSTPSNGRAARRYPRRHQPRRSSRRCCTPWRRL